MAMNPCELKYLVILPFRNRWKFRKNQRISMKHFTIFAVLYCIFIGNYTGILCLSSQTIFQLATVPITPSTTIVKNGSNTSRITTMSTDRTKQVDKIMIVSFVNGIYHSEADVQEISDYLKLTFQSDVRSFYNPSSGSWVKDAYKAGFEMVLRPNDLVLAKQLADHLRSALKEVRAKEGRVLHIAHSGGAILTYLAAKYHLSYSEANRIDIVTLGGGRSLTHKYFRGRIFNYYSRNDPVLLVEQRASRLMKRTKNETFDIVHDGKHNTTFVFLEAIAKDPIFDHSMAGPTYRKALAWEAEQFQQRLRQFMLVEAKDKDVVRRLRKQAANITGLHHFWNYYSVDNMALLGRRIRKYTASATNVHGLLSGKSRVANNITNTIFAESTVLSIAQNATKANNTITNTNTRNETVEMVDMLLYEESR